MTATYLINTTLCALLLYAVYCLLLEKENMHRFKRMYLLFSLVFSLTIPLVTVNLFVSQLPENVEVFYNNIIIGNNSLLEHDVAVVVGTGRALSLPAPETKSPINYPQIILSLYGLITLFFLFRLLKNSFQLLVSGRNNPSIAYGDVKNFHYLCRKITKTSMKTYDFDEITDRRGSGALKTDALIERYGRDDLIPLWVADMDFQSGDFITDALINRCKHGVFGYSVTPGDYVSSILNWVKNSHGWDVQKEWLSYIPGIVKGIAFCVMNFTVLGDKIIIQPPVYHPFRLVPQMQHREIVNNPLIEENGKYRMDLDGLRKMIDKDCKMLILCNPHNPIGITWDKETLAELAEICHEHHILIVSDEIHADMGIFGHKHIPFATVSPKAASNSITFMSPSKTFNIAGIVSSYAIVPDKQLRKNFYDFLHAGELDEGTIFAFTATQAAYENGKDWVQQMLRYIEGNILFVDDYLKKNIPQIKAVIPQASFLLWLDCRELNLNHSELVSLFVDKAHLALNDGEMFGPGGQGFMRMNIGCPRLILAQALKRLSEV